MAVLFLTLLLLLASVLMILTHDWFRRRGRCFFGMCGWKGIVVAGRGGGAVTPSGWDIGGEGGGAGELFLQAFVNECLV